jgi:hypothetical protein
MQPFLADFRRALPDFGAGDNVLSPCCVRRYAVDERIGGRAGLASARRQLASRGIRLILDYVPNHVAPDHPWSREHPEYFIPGTTADLADKPAKFLKINDHSIACGKDPFFPAWPDVLQLNAFNPGLRRAASRGCGEFFSPALPGLAQFAMDRPSPVPRGVPPRQHLVQITPALDLL